jgi:cytoskeleton protein RodZ
MSDTGISEEIGVAKEQAPQGEITAGIMMRRAREAAGLHVAALAVSMKIPVKKLEALEADRLDLLHDAVFVRALAASVCRALKIDPAPILNKLPLNATPRLNPHERSINTPFHSANDGTGLAVSELLKKPSTLIVLALVIAGGVVFFSPDIKLPDWVAALSSQTVKSPDAANQPQDFRPSTEVVEANSVAPPGTTSTISAPNSSNTPNAAIEAASTPPPSVASANMETLQLKVSAPASVPAVATGQSGANIPSLPSTGMVVFKAKGPTWVKVVDAKGVVQLSKTIVDGEVVGASGTSPLSVVIGRADITDVEVHGKPFTLTGVSKDNVARFEVK